MKNTLLENFNKLKEIEESDDPFCIGATKEDNTDGYTEVKEADFDADMKSGYPGDNDEPGCNTDLLSVLENLLNAITDIRGIDIEDYAYREIKDAEEAIANAKNVHER